jgi:predicted nuclease with TOPRIM domain
MYGKMLLMGRANGVPQYMLFCVLALTVETVLAHSYKNIDMNSMKEDGNELQDSEDDEFKNRMKRQEVRKQLLKTNVQERKAKIADFKKKYSKFYTPGSDLFLTMNIIGEFFAHLF